MAGKRRLTDEERIAHRRETYRKSNQKRYDADPDYFRERSRTYRVKRTVEQKSNDVARIRAWHEAHRDELAIYWRDNLLQKKYGLTFGQLQQALADQGFKCAICEIEIDEVSRRVDHDHESGAFRALLCHNCNVTLGLMKESPEFLRKAASYLELHAQKPTEGRLAIRR